MVWRLEAMRVTDRASRERAHATPTRTPFCTHENPPRRTRLRADGADPLALRRQLDPTLLQGGRLALLRDRLDLAGG